MVTTETTTADCELGNCPFRHVPSCCKTCTGRDGCLRRRQVCVDAWKDCIWQKKGEGRRRCTGGMTASR